MSLAMRLACGEYVNMGSGLELQHLSFSNADDVVIQDLINI